MHAHTAPADADGDDHANGLVREAGEGLLRDRSGLPDGAEADGRRLQVSGGPAGDPVLISVLCEGNVGSEPGDEREHHASASQSRFIHDRYFLYKLGYEEVYTRAAGPMVQQNAG